MTAPPELIASAVEDLRDLQTSAVWRDGFKGCHEEADLVLCRVLTELGAQEVVDEWKRVKKWYA